MKNTNGFTILEMIIAIAALSVMSIFILQMFISSSSLNKRTRNTDIALTTAVTAIENVKKHDSLSGYLAANENARPVNGAVTVDTYYDKNWNPTARDAASGAGFHLRMDITAAYGALYDVKAEVTALSPDNKNNVLLSLVTKKYFPAALDEGGTP